MRKITVISFLCVAICMLDKVHSLNILGVFPYPGRSHFFVFEPYLKELARRGHNLTVISYFPQKTPVTNLHDISLATKTEITQDAFPIYRTYWTMINIIFTVLNINTENCKTLLKNEQVQHLWKNEAKFDLILVEQFFSDCALGLAYQFKAPVVGLTTHTLMPHQFERFGITYNPSYVPHQLTEGGTKPTLYQRVERALMQVVFNSIHKYLYQREDENTLKNYFDNIPPLDELAKDVRFMFLYQHFSFTGSYLLPANVIEVNGYRVAKPKPLPSDLKKFIEESEHGVIYVSFGSMLKASSAPMDKITAIIAALSKLPQRVIWKWDETSLPSNPKNIFLSKWLPQNDVLAHPKVLAFFSHCGMLGTTEALYHGKPIVAMPIFGDQPHNAGVLEESGFAVQIQITELTKETLLEKLKTILDPKFQERAKRISKRWHDRPLSPMETMIFWTEYAVRNSDFSLKSAAVDVPMYQYLYLDIALILLGLTLFIFFAIKVIFAFIFGQNKRKAKKE